MGIDVSIATFLRSARDRGVSFEHTLTLGRQSLLVWGRDLADLELAEPTVEALLGTFGATHVDSIDMSDFEGATILHDLNECSSKPLGPYSAVLDAGTLEHVFNFPAAVATALRAVAVGGHYLAVSPANNEAGHGFYQFSPELWFRILSAQNGFRVEQALLKEMHRYGSWYEMCDPEAVGQRGSFISRGPTYLFFQARRVADVPLFDPFPQQSDYVAAWKGDAGSRGTNWNAQLPILRRVWRSTSFRVHWLRRAIHRWEPEPFYRASYRDQPQHFRRVARP